MMSVEEFSLVLSRLRGQVEEIYFHLMGEPMLHPSLPLFVSMANEAGFRTMITTNGSLIGDNAASRALLLSVPYRISISLHAPAANPAFSSEGYLSSCIDFAQRAAKLGTFAVLRLWNIGGEGERENSAILDILHTSFPGEWVERRGGQSVRLGTRTFLEWGEEFEWPDLAAESISPDDDAYCHGLCDQIGVLSDGRVVPCCLDSDGVITLGNLFETPLEEIISSPRACAIRDGFGRRRATEELCRRCGYARRFSKK
jgi:radical SAM protein with 4Fe4S-binding SPASM domain